MCVKRQRESAVWSEVECGVVRGTVRCGQRQGRVWGVWSEVGWGVVRGRVGFVVRGRVGCVVRGRGRVGCVVRGRGRVRCDKRQSGVCGQRQGEVCVARVHAGSSVLVVTVWC